MAGLIKKSLENANKRTRKVITQDVPYQVYIVCRLYDTQLSSLMAEQSRQLNVQRNKRTPQLP